MPEPRALAFVGAVAVLAIARGSAAAGPPVAFVAEPTVDAATTTLVRRVVASRRTIVPELPAPKPGAVSPAKAKDNARIDAIRRALDRARAAKGDADWDACVRESENAMSDAIDLLASAGAIDLLRDLHVEIGTCLTLANHVQDAPIHFSAATLLDESEPEWGRNKEAAEKAFAAARAEVLARRRGKVHVESVPPGAEVWIDGRKQLGVTPLDVDVRAGDHFVTLRRFRYEARTDLRLLQPDGAFRVVLDPASRTTTEDQLANVPTPAPSADELLFARAIYDRAEQIVVLRHGLASTTRVELFDAASGALVRGETLDSSAGDARTTSVVCRLLGETCEPAARGVPWWVWGIVGGVVVTAAAVTTGIVLYQNRDLEFCPAGGCR